MSTKDKFLNELQDLCRKYHTDVYDKDTNGIPGISLNNLPNRAITGIRIPIPGEDVYAYVSGVELSDAMLCRRKGQNDEHSEFPWIKCSDKMPIENHKGVSDAVVTIGGEGYLCVNFTIDGKWVKEKNAVAWTPIPKYTE